MGGSEADEATAHDLLPASDNPSPTEPRCIAERRVVGLRTVERLLQRRMFRPAGNSGAFWAKREEDDPFLPSAPRTAIGPLTPSLPVSSSASEVEPRASSAPRPRDPDAPARPRVETPPTSATPRSSPSPRASTPVASPSASTPVDRRPPIVPVKPPTSAPRSPGRLRMPTSSEPSSPPPARPPPSVSPRANTIDDYVAYISQLQSLEREYRERQTDEPARPAPSRSGDGLDDLLGEPSEGRVRIPRKRRGEG